MGKTTKRLLSFLTVLVMVIGMIPVQAFAADESYDTSTYVAQSDETEDVFTVAHGTLEFGPANTLTEAIECNDLLASMLAWNDPTVTPVVTLNEDYVVAEDFTMNGEYPFVLNLNGKTLTVAEGATLSVNNNVQITGAGSIAGDVTLAESAVLNVADTVTTANLSVADANGNAMVKNEAGNYMEAPEEPETPAKTPTEWLQEELDNAVAGTTIYLQSGVAYGTVYLRPTDSNVTEVTCYPGLCDYTTTSVEDFRAHWTGESGHVPYYKATIENVTIVGAEGATIAGIQAHSRHTKTDVQADAILGNANLGTQYTALSISNLTFQNVAFTGQVNIESSLEDAVYNGVTFDGCTFTTGGTAKANGAAIRYYNESSSNGNVRNITVENCSFTNCYQGVYTQHVNGVTVTGCTFDTLGHNAVAVQAHSNAAHGNVVITGNTFKNVADRVIRFNGVLAPTAITIQNNTATNSGDDKGEVMKATSIASGVVTSIKDNNWGEGKVVVNEELQDEQPAAPAVTYVAEVGGVQYGTLAAAIDAATEGATVTLLADVEQVDGIIITDKNITIDLNGKTFTVTEGASTNNRNFKINGSSVVTIKNGTMVAAGDYSSGAYGTVRTEGTANVTLTGLKLYNYRGGGLNVKVCSGTTVTINNSEIYAQYGGGVEAATGNVVLNNTKIVQKGVYGNGWYSVAMEINGGGSITVNSGNYYGSAIETDANAAMGNCVAFILSSGGTLTINGGTFTGVVSEEAAAANFCGIIYADKAAVVNINGGTFNSNGAILDMRNNAGSLPNPVATLTGGTFSADPTVSGLYSSNLITVADGYEVVENADGTYGVVAMQPETPAVVVVASQEEAQAALDDAVAGTTIQLTAGVNYGTLIFRANPGHRNTTLEEIADAWRYNYNRSIENITIIGADDAKVDGIIFATGAQSGDCNNRATVKNLVIDGVEFTDAFTPSNAGYNAPVMITTSNATVDGLTIRNCTLVGNNSKLNLLYLYGADGTKNITLTGNTVDGIARLCELRGTQNVTITNNVIKNTYEHGILLAGSGYSGNVTITGNTAEGLNNRFVRMAGAGDAVVVISNNTITNHKGTDADYIKVTDSTTGTVTIENNTMTPAAPAVTYVAQIDGTKYETLADAIAAAQAGDEIDMLADVVTGELTITKSITLNGNGYKLTPADSTKTYNSAIMVGDSGWGDDHGETITLVGLTFEGWKTNHGVIRAQGVTLAVDECEFNGNSVSNYAYAVLSLNFTDATVSSTKFVGNNDRAIDVNYNGDDSEAVVTIDGCTFERNTTTGAGIVMRSDGTMAVKNSTFKNNTVNTNGNGATVYVGFGAGNEVSGCTFENNTVITSHATTKRFASAIFCDGCVVKNNIFGADNTATRNGESISTIVAVGAYYGDADISGNYWNGAEPAKGGNYTVEYDKKNVTLNDYYSTCINGELGGKVSLVAPPIVVPENFDNFVDANGTKVEVSEEIQDVIEDIQNNTALNADDYKPVENHTDVEKLVVTLSGMKVADNVPTKITFNVEPKDANGNKVSTPAKSITFRLPIPEVVTVDYALVYHNDKLVGSYEIQGNDAARYVEITSANFSEFAVEPVNKKYVASVNGTKYESLQDAINAATEGATVTLLADIALDKMITVPAEKTLTIDGNNKKLTPSADFITNGHNAVIVLADGDRGYSENSKYTIKNLTFEGFGGLRRVVRANFCKAVIEACTFNNNSVSGGVITSADAELTVTGCTFAGNTVEGGAAYGVIDLGSDVSEGTGFVADITNNTFTANTVDYAVLFLFSSANVTGNTFNGNTHAGSNPNAAAVTAGPYTGNMAYTINVNGNAFVNALSKGESALPAVYAEDWKSLGANTAFDLSANYWGGAEPVKGTDYATNTEDANLTLKSYYTSYNSETGALNNLVQLTLEGIGTEASPYLINTLDDLEWFRDDVNAGNDYNGKYVKLTADIDMSSVENWIPIGANGFAFRGYFDGADHTISNLKITDTSAGEDKLGLFGYIQGKAMNANQEPSVKNLKLTDANISSTDAASYIGALVANPYVCYIKNVHVTGTISGGKWTGGVIGNGYVLIEDASFEGTVTSNNQAGGIAGAGDARVYNSKVIGNITANYWAGGVIGNGQEGASAVGCYVKGTITANNNYYFGIGGIAGVSGHGYAGSKYENNYFDGEVYLEGAKVNSVVIGLVNAESNAAIKTEVTGNSWNTAYYPADTLVYVVGDVSRDATPDEWAASAAKTDERNNNLVMLESDLAYVDAESITDVTKMSFSTVTDDEIAAAIAENNVVAQIGDDKYQSLQAAIDAAGQGNTVTVVTNIVLTDTVTIPADKTITLDLNGKVISQTKAQTANYQMILNDGNLTIVDNVGGGKLSYTDTCGGNFISNTITNRGTLILKSGTVENLSSAAVAAAGYPYAIDTSIGGEASEVNVFIEGGKVYCESYSALRLRADSETEAVNITISGGEVYGRIEVQNPTRSKVTVGKLTVTDGVINKNNSSMAVMIFGDNSSAEGLDVEITGGTFTGEIGYSAHFPVTGLDENIISGGSFSSDVSDFCVAGYTAKQNTDGNYSVAKDPYAIANLEDLKAFRDQVIAGDRCFGETWYLAADIDLTGEDWIPIGSNSNPFQGTFDGKGHTISNLTITGRNEMVGLFGRVNNTGGEIKNLTIHNAKISGHSQVGVLVGSPGTFKVSNIKITGHVEIDGYQFVGAVGGKNANADWDNVIVDVDATSFVKAISTIDGVQKSTHVGGVIGMNGEIAHSLTNISSNIKVIGDVKYIGGLFGTVNGNNTVENVTFTGTVEAAEGATHVGAIAGNWVNTHGTSVIINNATFSAATVKVGGELVAATVVGGSYYTYDTADTSGKLLVDGIQKWPAVVKIGSTYYDSLEEAANNAVAGDEIVLLADCTLSTTLALPTGITLNGNGKQINGTISAEGDLTFAGHTKVTAFAANYNGDTITIGEGACLEITGTGRVTLGYGNTFNITGTITDAKTADKSAVQASLIIPGGTSITGYNGVTFNVTNAYIKMGSSSSKNYAATDEFNMNFTNSIVEFTNQFTLSAPTSGKTPTFNVIVKDSVMTVATKLCIAAADSNVIIDNSVVTLGTYLRNSGELTLRNGAVLSGAMIQFGENGGNDGTITVDASTLTIKNNNAAYAMDGNNTGKLNVVNGGNASIDYITETAVTVDSESSLTAKQITDTCSITIDAEKFVDGEAKVLTLTTALTDAQVAAVNVINNSKAGIKITAEGVSVIIKPVAKIGNVEYKTLAEALAAVQDGETVTLLSDVALSSTLVFNKAGTYTIDGNGHTITNNGATNAAIMLGDSGWNTNSTTHSYTLKNVVFDGWNTDHVVRVQGVDATIEGCTFMNCTNASVGIVTVNYSDATITGNVFKDNTCAKVIDAYTWSSVGAATITGNTITGNTVSDTAAIFYNGGEGCTITGNTITNNTISSGNTAVVYLRRGANTAVTGNVITGNTITAAAGAERAAVLVAASGATVTKNAFAGNTINAAEGTSSGVVVTKDSSGDSSAVNVSGNYWGGVAPGELIGSTDGVDWTATTYYAGYENGQLVELKNLGYVAQIGNKKYESLKDALYAAQEGDIIQLLADTISEGAIKLPAVMKNVTIKSENNTVLKDMTISAHDGNTITYVGLTFDGIVFDNSNIVITGQRTGLETLENLTITNCQFKNIVRTDNIAALHMNLSAGEPLKGFTFTNNVIDGVGGSSNSGININQLTGNVTIENNVINNVAFRPLLLQVVNNDNIADVLTINGNTFSGSANGRLQILGTGGASAGTDNVAVNINNNVFTDITATHQLCVYNFNAEKTTTDFSKNYYDVDVEENADLFYYNSEASSVADLINMGVYPYYADEAKTILVEAPVASITSGRVTYYYKTLQDAFDDAWAGDTIVLLRDVELAATATVVGEKNFTLDLNGHNISAGYQTGSTDKHLYAIENYGTLTLTNSKATGEINSRGIYNYGTLNVNAGVTINSIDANGGYAIDNYDGAYLVVNGATIATTYEDGDGPGEGYDATPINIRAGANAVIKDAKIINVSNYTYAIANSGTLVIDDAEVTAVFGCVSNLGGTATIRNGNYTVTGAIGGHAVYVEGGAVTIENGTYKGYDTNEVASYAVFAAGGTTEIKNGSFESGYINTVGAKDTSTIAISGGTYDKAPAEKYIVDGMYAAENADGTYTIREVSYVAQNMTTGEKYVSVNEAIKAAQDGDTIYVFAGTITEHINPWNQSEPHSDDKSITLLGANWQNDPNSATWDSENETVITGGMFIGHGDGCISNTTVTVKGFTFVDKGLTIAGQQNVVVENNKFEDITRSATSGTDASAVNVTGQSNSADSTVLVQNNYIDGTGDNGINLNQTVNATVVGNFVTNTKNNSITIHSKSYGNDAKEIKIQNNTLSNWGYNNDSGRAIRIGQGQNVTVTGNVMTNANAPEQYVKITIGNAPQDVSENYWDGVNPMTQDIFATDSTTAKAEILDTYYEDAAKTRLLPVLAVGTEEHAFVDLNGNGTKEDGEYASTVEDALAAASAIIKNSEGEVTAVTVILMENAYAGDLMVKTGITLDLNGYKLTADCLVALDGAHVIDTTNGTARLIIGMRDVILAENNAMLPVYDGTGYIFSKFDKCAVKIDTTYTGEGIRINASPAPILVIAELLKDGASDNNLEVVIRLSWTSDKGEGHQDFKFNENVIADVFSSNKGTQTGYGKMFAMTVTGLESISQMNAHVVLISGTKCETVSLKSATYTNPAK